jgi:hypothetical protein
MISDLKGALALLKTRGVLTLTACPGHTSLVQEIAGEVRGSWWSHPQGSVIFQIGEGLEASPDVLTAKLVQGKVTFVHRALWPALLRVVTDPSWRATQLRGLTAPARRLLEGIDASGELQLPGGIDLGPKATVDRARKELELKHLVRSHSEHTSTGSHATVLQSWSHWASPAIRAKAEDLTLEKARSVLDKAGLAVGSLEKEVKTKGRRPPARAPRRAPRAARGKRR